MSSSRTLTDKCKSALLLACERLLPALDRLVPKSSRRWAFPYTRAAYWSSNQRALFDFVSANRSDIDAAPVDLSAPGRRWLLERRDVWHLLRSRVVVIHHGPSDYREVFARRSAARRVIYNVWHGVNIKAIGLEVASNAAELDELRGRAEFYHGLAASSAANRDSLSAGLGVDASRVHITGLPRNDWLVCAESELPAHLAAQLRQLRELLAGRRLVFYAPTFRESASGGSQRDANAGFYPLDPLECRQLDELLARHSAVLGCRAHVNASPDELPPGSIDLGAAVFPETQVLLREAALLVTDYSGIWVDYLLTGRPMLAFCHDRERYAGERGLIYDMAEVFPGARMQHFDQFCAALDAALAGQAPHGLYPKATALFHAHTDARSSERVVTEIERLVAAK